MTIFLRLLETKEKPVGLTNLSKTYRASGHDGRIFNVNPHEFFGIPSAPFAYWVSSAIRSSFKVLPAFEDGGRKIRVGLQTSDDYRFIRAWWEPKSLEPKWRGFAKGGNFSPFYSDVYLVVNWNPGERELWSIINPNLDKPKSNIWMLKDTIKSSFFRIGITWPRRTKSKLSMRALPKNCVFSDKSPTVFSDSDSTDDLLVTMALASSRAFQSLVETQLAAADSKAGGAAHSFEAGVIQRTPLVEPNKITANRLLELSKNSWSFRKSFDTINETSHAFSLPAALQVRFGDHDALDRELELARIQAEIDRIAFDIYGFSDADRAAAMGLGVTIVDDTIEVSQDPDDGEEDEITEIIDLTDGLLSWATGVAFGRFDWRLVTGERATPPAPGPFDPLPAKSPGMLPDGAVPLHTHDGILVDDQGHPHDLPRLIEDILARVEAPTPADVRRWLQRDFFPLHLMQYSKSRRKAPIYWPISTVSGSYTLWLYYPSLSSQTLYTAVNDFIEGPNGKLSLVERESLMLREKGSARSSEEERRYEALQALELELIELRDTLLQIAPTYHPNHDDGVQITAAPLWKLFRHKPWQKILKDTWAKLEKGEYDWAHLAMAYWPGRVRDKCKTDKSLAIAHDLEHLYVEPEPRTAKARGLKKDAE